ncbi:MAG: AraC family transcriptional regulator ligand-binding domain-containing protein [Oleispira sp.]
MSSKICLSLLYPYLAQANVLGFDRSFLLSELGLSESHFKEAMKRIPFSDFLSAVHKLILITKSPALGLKSGAHYHPSTFGPLAYLMLNSATVGQAYQSFLTYEPMINEAVKTESIAKGEAVINYVAYEGYSDGDVAPLVEAHIASLLAYTNFLSFRPNKEQGSSLIKEILFRHSPQTDISKYKKFFGIDVQFNQAVNSFSFDPIILDYVIPGADPRIVSRAVMELDAIQSSRRSERQFSSEVYDFIKEGFYDTLPTAADAASMFAMSMSTFQRRLKEESITFKGLVEQVRMDKAEVHLADLRLNLADVASRLGFSDTPAFFKAFKRWTGETPADYRKKIIKLSSDDISHHD